MFWQYVCIVLNMWKLNTESVQANAVRYGTAKGEWFLNVVRLLSDYVPPLTEILRSRYHTDCGTPVWRGCQNPETVPEVLGWI